MPRWSSISTRKSASARSSQPGELGCRVGRGASLPGAALQEDEQRPVAPVGVGDLAREDRDALAVGAAWSSGTANSCSVSTRPRVADEEAMPGFSTLRARGPQRARDPGPRLPAREAAHHARRLPPEPQRAAPGVQPGDQPRSRHRVRRGGDPRRAAPPVAAPLGAPGQRRGQPRAEVPPPARRGAGPARGRARGAVRPHAPRAADPGRAQAAHRAPAPAGRSGGGARRARAAHRPRPRRAPAAPAGAEGGALRAPARRRRRRAGRAGARRTGAAMDAACGRSRPRGRRSGAATVAGGGGAAAAPTPIRASSGWRTRWPPCARSSRRCAPRSTPCAPIWGPRGERLFG